MIILSSLSSGTPTPIPTSSWLQSESYTDPSSWTVDSWANKVVFLLGTVHNFWLRIRNDTDRILIESHKCEWQQLDEQIRRHESACPMTCRPLSVVRQEAYEAVGFPNGSAAAAWQMYHTLALVHATSVPSVPTERALILRTVSEIATDLASKIVANSATNRIGTAWVNAVQLLATAGQCLVDVKIQKVCALTLEDIRQATRWNTTDSLALLGRVWGPVCREGCDDAQSEIGELLLRLVDLDETLITTITACRGRPK